MNRKDHGFIKIQSRIFALACDPDESLDVGEVAEAIYAGLELRDKVRSMLSALEIDPENTQLTDDFDTAMIGLGLKELVGDA